MTLQDELQMMLEKTRRYIKSGWCPSIACMKYVQRAPAGCYPPEARDTSTSRERHLFQSSGEGDLRSMCRSAAIASRDVRPRRG